MTSASPDPTTDARLADLDKRLRAVEKANINRDVRIRRGERQRVFFAVAGVVVSSIAVAALIFALYVLAGRGDTRAFYNQQIKMLDARTSQQVHNLACLVPPGNAFTDGLRKQYHCGPYHKPSKENP